MEPVSTYIWSAVLGIVVLGANAQSLNSECYRMVKGRQHATSPGGGPCGILSTDTGYLSCCAVGDQCVEGGLCRFTHKPNLFWHQSGYYIGGCTDPSLNDPACNLGCKDLSVGDVTFDPKTKIWHCCGTNAAGNVTCNEPTTATAVAKPIASLATTYVVPSTVRTTSATGTHSSAPSTPSTNIPGSQKSAGGTSQAGPIAGGVIGGVALIAIVIGGWFWYRRRRSLNANPQSSTGAGYELAGEGYYAPLGKAVKEGRSELHNAAPNAMEMDGRNLQETRGVVELP